MKTIWKYELELKQLNEISMPFEAQILPNIHASDTGIFIWAIVDTKYSLTKRVFEIVGTGREIAFDPDTEKIYISTIADYKNTGYVWHLFEVKRRL